MTLNRLALRWEPGQHLIISGGTGSGKTTIARYINQVRLHGGGTVIVFVSKVRADATITEFYSANDGWKRFKTWHVPKKDERRILLWPAVEGKNPEEVLTEQRKVFNQALDYIANHGQYTVQLDEGLYMTSREFINAYSRISMMFQMMRSSGGSIILLTQRPSGIPLSAYANIDHAFISRPGNEEDLKRLANLGGGLNKRALTKVLSANGKHDFVWIDVYSDNEPIKINLAE